MSVTLRNSSYHNIRYAGNLLLGVLESIYKESIKTNDKYSTLSKVPSRQINLGLRRSRVACLVCLSALVLVALSGNVSAQNTPVHTAFLVAQVYNQSPGQAYMGAYVFISYDSGPDRVPWTYQLRCTIYDTYNVYQWFSWWYGPRTQLDNHGVVYGAATNYRSYNTNFGMQTNSQSFTSHGNGTHELSAACDLYGPSQVWHFGTNTYYITL